MQLAYVIGTSVALKLTNEDMFPRIKQYRSEYNAVNIGVSRLEGNIHFLESVFYEN